MSMTETGLSARSGGSEPALTKSSMIPATRPPCQPQLPLRVSARAVLSGIEFAHNVFGEDNESIIARVDNALHPAHLRFVFDMSAGDRQVRELRFWNTEIIAPESIKGLTIHQAIQEILGGRDASRRAEIGIQWSLSSNHLTRLVRSGDLVETGNRLLRATLENFLLRRWIGAPLTKL